MKQNQMNTLKTKGHFLKERPTCIEALNAYHEQLKEDQHRLEEERQEKAREAERENLTQNLELHKNCLHEFLSLVTCQEFKYLIDSVNSEKIKEELRKNEWCVEKYEEDEEDVETEVIRKKLAFAEKMHASQEIETAISHSEEVVAHYNKQLHGYGVIVKEIIKPFANNMFYHFLEVEHFGCTGGECGPADDTDNCIITCISDTKAPVFAGVGEYVRHIKMRECNILHISHSHCNEDIKVIIEMK